MVNTWFHRVPGLGGEFEHFIYQAIVDRLDDREESRCYLKTTVSIRSQDRQRLAHRGLGACVRGILLRRGVFTSQYRSHLRGRPRLLRYRILWM